MERAPQLRLKREIEASGDEEAVEDGEHDLHEPQEENNDLDADHDDPVQGGDADDHEQEDNDDDSEETDDEGDDDSEEMDQEPSSEADGGHLDLSETEEAAEASGDSQAIDYLRDGWMVLMELNNFYVYFSSSFLL